MNRYESTKKVSFIGLISNLFLMCLKMLIALLTSSKAMFADAINSAGDIFSSLMTYIGNKISSAPSDEDHNFGHGKAEYIFSLIIGISMIFIASKIFIDSLISIFSIKTFTFSWYLIIVALITIITKISLYFYCKYVYKIHKNILIKATMKDHRNDAFLSVGTLISALLGYFKIYYFDGIFGSLISLYIIITGIGIFLESYKILMDVSLDKEYKAKIINDIKQNKNIVAITDFYTVATGYKYIAILTINVDGNMKTFTSHAIADDLENTIPKNYRKISKVIIHVNPVSIKKKK